MHSYFDEATDQGDIDSTVLKLNYDISAGVVVFSAVVDGVKKDYKVAPPSFAVFEPLAFFAFFFFPEPSAHACVHVCM